MNCRYCLRPVQPVTGRGRPRIYCSLQCTKAADSDSKIKPPVAVKECAKCGIPFFSLGHGHSRRTCSDRCKDDLKAEQARNRYDPAKERVRYSRRSGLRAVQTDLTPEYVARLYAARTCPLCAVRLTRQPGPAQAQLDHIVPLNVGGTHTVGNVRVICRTCNLTRPRDGSDHDGQTTIWATRAA